MGGELGGELGGGVGGECVGGFVRIEQAHGSKSVGFPARVAQTRRARPIPAPRPSIPIFPFLSSSPFATFVSSSRTSRTVSISFAHRLPGAIDQNRGSQRETAGAPVERIHRARPVPRGSSVDSR